MIEPTNLKVLDVIGFSAEDPYQDLDGQMYVGFMEGTAGDYVETTLPPEGLNTITWTGNGKTAVYYNSITESQDWGLHEIYKPEFNEITGVVQVTHQQDGKYWCIGPRNLIDKAVIGDVRYCPVGDSRTAMPGQWLAICSGAFIKDGQTIDKPTFIYADTESISISCIEEGFCSRIELVPVADIATRYNDEI